MIVVCAEFNGDAKEGMISSLRCNGSWKEEILFSLIHEK